MEDSPLLGAGPSSGRREAPLPLPGRGLMGRGHHILPGIKLEFAGERNMVHFLKTRDKKNHACELKKAS